MTLPHANACLVAPGLLAGQYPGAETLSATRIGIRQHLDAGIRLFIDLTEPGELTPYDAVLAEEATRAGVVARHVRFPIPDVGVPAAPDTMRRILDAMADGRTDASAYVHCWGGVGRTGTAVGCFLRRHGAAPDDALATVQRLYSTVEKVHRIPLSPETDAQRAYVRCWTEP